MFFASRYASPPVSETLQFARDALVGGRYAAAWRLIGEAQASCWMLLPGDALLAAEAARAVGCERRYRAIVRLARRYWPDDPHVLLEWVRRQAESEEAEQAIGEMDAWKADGRLPASLHALADAISASMRARMQRQAQAMASLQSLDDAVLLRDVRVAYTVGHAWSLLRDWGKAAAAFRLAVQAVPGWHRARASLAHALMAGGACAQARQSIAQQSSESGDEPFDYQGVFLRLALHDIAGSYQAAQAYLSHWPDGDARGVIEAWALQAACLLQDADAVRACMADADSLLAAPRRLLPLPPLCQARHQCVPTAAAMVAAWHGDPQAPDTLYAALGGLAGVDMWRLRGHFEARGYRVEYVRMEAAVLRGLLARGLPVIGLVDTLFSSHVDVVCGYDAGTGVFYRRDPERWAIQWCTAAALEHVYGAGGGAGMVLVPPASSDQSFDPLWRHPDAVNLDALRAACASGDLGAATHNYALIGDDSPLALQRSQIAQGIVEAPGVFGRSLLRIVQNPSLPSLVRWRALTMIDDAGVLQRYKRDVLEGLPGRAALRFLDGVEHAAAGRWPQARDELMRLTRRHRSHVPLWLRLAQAQVQSGDPQAARHSAARALEAGAHAPAVAAHVAALFPDLYGRAERLRRWRLLRGRQHGSHAAVMAEADAREAGRQGPAYERALRRCIDRAPLEGRHYDRLVQWYFSRGQPERARAVLDLARQRLTPPVAPDQGEAPGQGSLTADNRVRFESWVRGVRKRHGMAAALSAVCAQRQSLGESTATALAAMLYVDDGNADAARVLLEGHSPADALDAQHAQLTRARLAMLTHDYASAEQIFQDLRTGTAGR